MEEKKASGEWIEKSKWKSMERKAALAEKTKKETKAIKVESGDQDIEGNKSKKVRKRAKNSKKKNEKAKKVTEISTGEPEVKKVKTESSTVDHSSASV